MKGDRSDKERHDQKVLVISYSGNVGKTTIAKELLAPRMEAPVLSVGTVGEDASSGASGDGNQFTAAEFGDLYNRVLTLDTAIVDVAGSSIDEFLALMGQFHRAHELFGCCLIPVASGAKPQREALRTIDALTKMSVPSARICVLFNKVDAVEGDDFDLIFAQHKAELNFSICQRAVIFESDVFEVLRPFELSVAQMAVDTADYTQMRHEAYAANNDVVASVSLWMSVAQRLAAPMKLQLDQVYKELFQ